MSTVEQVITDHITDRINQIIPELTAKNTITHSPQIDMGDFAFPCFELSKELKKNPVQIAQELAEKIEKDENILIDSAAGDNKNLLK